MTQRPASTWLPNSDIYIIAYGHRAVEDEQGVVHLSRFGAPDEHLAALACVPTDPAMGTELRGVRFVYADLTCLTCIAGTRG